MRLKAVTLIIIFIVCACKEGSNFAGSSESKEEAKPTPAPEQSPSPSPVPTQNTNNLTPTTTPQTNFPPTATTKGRFTVWAEPANPQPRQSYRIMISVEQAAQGPAINPQELYASVRGTDNFYYDTTIPVLIPNMIQVASTAQGFMVSILIPGAHYLVQDQVGVSIARLNENENFIVVFQ